MDEGTRRVEARVRVRGGELSLARVASPDGPRYELAYDGRTFRSSADDPVSEEMIDAIFRAMGRGRNLDLLIGGLGFGAALRRALSLSSVRKVTVVELDRRVAAWGRDRLDLGEALDDRRTELVIGSFADFVHGSPVSYHGIAIDVDAGPEAVVRPENRRAYSLSTLRSLAARLRAGGRLTVRGASTDRAYRRALEEIFPEVEVIRAAEPEPGGVIYVAGS